MPFLSALKVVYDDALFISTLITLLYMLSIQNIIAFWRFLNFFYNSVLLISSKQLGYCCTLCTAYTTKHEIHVTYAFLCAFSNNLF